MHRSSGAITEDLVSAHANPRLIVQWPAKPPRPAKPSSGFVDQFLLELLDPIRPSFCLTVCLLAFVLIAHEYFWGLLVLAQVLPLML